LLSERPALRAALRELPSLASTAHITKGTTWALGPGETLAAISRPLGRPAHTANSFHPAGPTGAYPGHPASPAGPAYPTDTPNTASPPGRATPPTPRTPPTRVGGLTPLPGTDTCERPGNPTGPLGARAKFARLPAKFAWNRFDEICPPFTLILFRRLTFMVP
jgi:hypothetical protein